MDDESRRTGDLTRPLRATLDPKRIPTANGGLHAISLLTKERVQRFARQQCDRAQSDFVAHAKAFGRVLGESLTPTQKGALLHSDPNRSGTLEAGAAQRLSTVAARPSGEGRARLLESLLIEALKAAEQVARGARRLGDTTRLFDIRSQMVVLSYTAASLRSGGPSAGLYERTLHALDRVDELAGFRQRPARHGAAAPQQGAY